MERNNEGQWRDRVKKEETDRRDKGRSGGARVFFCFVFRHTAHALPGFIKTTNRMGPPAAEEPRTHVRCHSVTATAPACISPSKEGQGSLPDDGSHHRRRLSIVVRCWSNMSWWPRPTFHCCSFSPARSSLFSRLGRPTFLSISSSVEHAQTLRTSRARNSF